MKNFFNDSGNCESTLNKYFSTTHFSTAVLAVRGTFKWKTRCKKQTRIAMLLQAFEIFYVSFC